MAVQLYQHQPEWGLVSMDPMCVAAHALLLSVGVPVEVVNCNNEQMSVTGELPILRRADQGLHYGFDGVVKFVARRQQGHNESPAHALGSLEAGDITAFKALVINRLQSALAYELWCEPQNYEAVAFPLYGARRFPFPLSRFLCWQKKRLVANECLQRRGVPDVDTLYTRASVAYDALAEKLDSTPFFVGDSLTELDALVYGHLAVVLAAPLPAARLRSLVQRHPVLVAFHDRVTKALFSWPPALINHAAHVRGVLEQRPSSLSL